MIKFIDGNIFDSSADIICHQCNNRGAFNSGIAREVRERYPNVYESYFDDYQNGRLKLGYVNFTLADSCRVIANMVAQDGYGYDGKKYTDYVALQKCLKEVRRFADMMHNEYPVIAFPYKMSCVRGGGDWNVVYNMIENTFEGFDVEIWRFDNG